MAIKHPFFARASVALSLVALSFMASAQSAAQETTANDVAAATKLQGYLDALTSFEARFVQRITDSRSQVEESSGRFFLQRPGRLRWDYEKPQTQVIVTDGQRLWVYDKELRQVTVRAIDAAIAATPAMLLAGKASLSEGFNISTAEAREGLEWMRMEPKRNDTDFLSVELGFKQGELRAMELRDKLGQTTRIDFTGVRRNARLDAKLFDFKPPKGVDVIGTP